MNIRTLVKVELFKRSEFERIPIAESNGGSAWRFSSKQVDALRMLTNKETRFVGYGGSAFSGKSYLLCYWELLASLAYPGTAWGIGRKELSNLRKSTIETFFKIASENQLRDKVDFSFNQQLNIITFNNESKIYMIDMAYRPSDPLYMRLGGLELTGAAVDESAECDEKSVIMLSTRIGRRNNERYGLKAKMLETFNPAKNHVYNRYYKPFKGKKLSKDYCFIPALPKDNPSPEAAQYIIDMLATGDEVTIERLVNGNFEYDDDPAKLCSYDKILDIFTNEYVHTNYLALNKPIRYITADIARYGSDKAVIAIWDDWTVIDLVVYYKCDMPTVQNKIKELQITYSIPNSRTLVDEDGIGGGVKDNIGCKGFTANKPPVKKSKNNYTNLKTQCYYLLAEKINNGEFYIEKTLDVETTNCIIGECEQIKRDDIDSDGKLKIIPKEKIKAIIGHSPDFTDTFAMRVYFDLNPPMTA